MLFQSSLGVDRESNVGPARIPRVLAEQEVDAEEVLNFLLRNLLVHYGNLDSEKIDLKYILGFGFLNVKVLANIL